MDSLSGGQEHRVWHQLDGESRQAYAAFCVYRDLPKAERSLDAAYEKAAKKQQKSSKKTRASGTWFNWCSEFNWVARAKAHDDYLQQIADEAEAENIRQIMNSSYAQQHKRVQFLCEILDTLKDDVLNKHYLKTTIVSTNGSVVESETFNEGIFRVVDKMLDSIAKEKGDRSTKKLEIKFQEMSNEQLARFILAGNTGQK